MIINNQGREIRGRVAQPLAWRTLALLKNISSVW